MKDLMKYLWIFLVGPDLEQNQNRMAIKVNLPPELMEMIEEVLHLEQMGFRINERIRNIALIKDNLISNSRMLEDILNHYYAIRRRLGCHEVCCESEINILNIQP
jgi:hypothetical protein